MKTITRLVLTVAIVAVITITPEARQAVTIDTLMATPFPTDLIAAPSGGAIAWVSSNSGVHNILIAEPSPGSGPMAGRTDHKWRAVTTYTYILMSLGYGGDQIRTRVELIRKGLNPGTPPPVQVRANPRRVS